MAIVKNSFNVSRVDREFSPMSTDSLLSGDDENPLGMRSSVSVSEEEEQDDDDDCDDFNDGYVDDVDDVDSGAGSDDFDLSELGEIGAEFCLMGNCNCSVPFELYDLPDLSGILSLDTWNNCLSEDERFSLAEYLPDMDQETFSCTLKELFSGCNFHFGSPLTVLFDRLKGGLCEPRAALYWQGLNFFEKRKHYHLLRNYQNSMVGSLVQIRNAWENCTVYGIEERLRVLNLQRSRAVQVYEKDDDEDDDGLGSDADSLSREESDEGLLSNRHKKSNRALYTVRPPLDVLSQGMVMTLKPTKYGKRNRKGILKVATPHPSALPLTPSLPKGQAARYDLGSPQRGGSQMNANVDESEQTYEMDVHKFRNGAQGGRCGMIAKEMQGKRHVLSKKYNSDDRFRLADEDLESYGGLPFPVKKKNLHSYSKTGNAKQMTGVDKLIEKPFHDNAYDYPSRDAGKPAKYLERPRTEAIEDRMNPSIGRGQQSFLKETRADWLPGSQIFRNRKAPQRDFSMDHPVKFDESNFRSKKQRTAGGFEVGKKNAGLDSEVRLYRTIGSQMTGSRFHSDYKSRASQESVRRKSAQNGGTNKEDPRNSRVFLREVTDSDSSDQLDEDGVPSHYPNGASEGGQSAAVRSIVDPEQMNKIARKGKSEYRQHRHGDRQSLAEVGETGVPFPKPEIEIYSSKGTQRTKMTEVSYQHDHGNVCMEGRNLSTSAKLSNNQKQTNKSAHNVHDDRGEKSNLLFPKPSVEKKYKGKVDLDYTMPLSNYKRKRPGVVGNDDSHVTLNVDVQERIRKSGDKDQNTKLRVTKSDDHERINIPLVGCNSIMQKQKGKVDFMHLDGPEKRDSLQPSLQKPVDDPNFMKKQWKKKADVESRSLPMITSDSVISGRAVVDAEPETKLPKKPFTLITPSIHSGFSFSVIHLLSAVRRAMIISHAGETTEVDRHHEKREGGVFPSHENLDARQKGLPSLTVQEIVSHVRSNPGDPCILETQEPLQDLVRGVLKIFSSKTAPLGAKAWKALVCYEKSTKSWSWIGPISPASLDRDAIEEETSPEAWGIPHKMLVKLVDAFANWLKSGQETLKQIGSLPAPPLTLPTFDEKERFKDLRAQKSLNTISPSSDEMRAYFRREEFLRYSIPDRAFSYTAADGRKSIVAPLRRCGGKPTSKAREHYMLKPDRPPHVTILCLVRDAAARLPGSTGTRADVCTLIRDSQYIVEDISDAQVNQIVSGALDRLHYERDPCVQFDAERKLWVYLHRDREEEDFEDDGTSSTKKWKRPRKGTVGHSVLGATNDVDCQGTEDQDAGGSSIGDGFRSDLNVESPSTYAEKKTQPACHDLKPKTEGNIGPFVDSGESSIHQGPLGWDVLDLNPMKENKIVCQENSGNVDIDEEHSASQGQLDVKVQQSSMRRMDNT